MPVKRKTDTWLPYCYGMEKEEKSADGRTPFGLRLHAARKAKGFTQKYVEMHVGIAQSNLAELEREGTGSSFTVALALLYGVNPVWLALGKEPMSGGVPAPAWLQDLTDDERKQVQQFAENLIFARTRERT
jgi:transcriptional regulator with XRE-family HTH domain